MIITANTYSRFTMCSRGVTYSNSFNPQKKPRRSRDSVTNPISQMRQWMHGEIEEPLHDHSSQLTVEPRSEPRLADHPVGTTLGSQPAPTPNPWLNPHVFLQPSQRHGIQQQDSRGNHTIFPSAFAFYPNSKRGAHSNELNYNWTIWGFDL